MKIRTDRYLDVETLNLASLFVFGSAPTDLFHGPVLRVSEARLISEALITPPAVGSRLVACSFNSVNRTSLDALLRPLEDSEADFILCTDSVLPETVRSRLSLVASNIPTVTEIYSCLSSGRESSLYGKSLISGHPINPALVDFWKDRYQRSLGRVSFFLSNVADGNHESSLRCAFEFTADDLDLLSADLECQIEDKNLCGVSLSRVPKEYVQRASRCIDTKSSASVFTKVSAAALVLCS